jgi:hypothetical protein
LLLRAKVISSKFNCTQLTPKRIHSLEMALLDSVRRCYAIEELLDMRISLPRVNFPLNKVNNHPDLGKTSPIRSSMQRTNDS